MSAVFDLWLASIGVEASKVQIKAEDGGECGLFATHDIFPGERIIHLPSTALLTDEWLRTQGLRSLETIHNDTIELTREQLVVGMIEELRQLLNDDNGTSMVHMVSRSMQYDWRKDDAVSLYLIAARKLAQEQVEPSVIVQSSSLHTDESQAAPILVCDVVPVASEGFESEQEDHEKVGGQDEPDKADDEVASSRSFVPYVAMVPESFPTSPLYFPDDILVRMEGTNCHEFTKRMLLQMEADWTQLSAILRAYLTMDDKRIPSSDDCLWDPDADFEQYKWALCCIYSRSTDFLVQEGHQRVMAPLFDMMNHAFDSHVTHEMDSRGNMSVFAGSHIQAGSEIFLNYGNFPNEKLLLVYGFTVPSNPYDAVQIYAPIPADSSFALKAQILNTKYGIVDPDAPHTLRRDQSIPESLLCTLRLIGLQSEDEVVSASEATFNTFDGVISVENECGALTALRQALHTMARRLALNLISDENLNAASGIKGATTDDASHSHDAHVGSARSEWISRTNIEHCKILCQSEYLILQSALQELNSRLEQLQGPEYEVLSQ
ncbi:histone-lysine N-methyltransferase [Fragilaria crotonensis]|nr:histone-lysine N-methyltransferase [Fragilaria crotonensis]